MSESILYNYEDFMEKEFPFKLEVRNNRMMNTRVHAHNHLQICYVSKGACIHSVTDKQAVVAKGDIFSVPPYLEHSTLPIEDADTELFQIDFMPYLINENMRDISNLESFFDFAYIVQFNKQPLQKLNLSAGSQIEVEQLLRNMRKEFGERQEGWQIAVKADLLKLLVVVGRENRMFLEGRQKKQMIQVHRRAFHETLAYLKEHFHEELSLEAMAVRAAMAPTYFSYTFKMITGKNYIEYLNELRIQNAITLLETSDLNITDISMSSGYNHLSHFNRMFKKYVGITPTLYRKSMSG